MKWKMKNYLEKFFNHWTLLFLNILIIISVELTGMFFMDSGLIHLIALFFIVLGATRIFVHYDVYDQYLKPLIHGGILVLLVFAISHILEYVSYAIFYVSYDIIAVNVVNLYLVGLLITSLSVEMFLGRLKNGGRLLVPLFHLGIITFLVLTVSSLVNGAMVNLEVNGLGMFIYSSLVILVTLVCIGQLFRLRSRVTILVNFLNYFVASFALVSCSAMLYVLNEMLVRLGLPYFQMMYIGHFIFYAALSIMFLAYVKLSKLGGIYEDLKDIDEN